MKEDKESIRHIRGWWVVVGSVISSRVVREHFSGVSFEDGSHVEIRRECSTEGATFIKVLRQ
jgi:hypothetical protein